jgi:hypothetical protein
MRLLNAHTLEFQEFHDDTTRPKYAILSHTWDEKEVVYKEMRKHRDKAEKKKGFEKITLCAKQTLKDDLDYFWIDTCCIDKSSSAELSEAINSMFRWYRDSEVCYAYLPDITLNQPGQALGPRPTGKHWIPPQLQRSLYKSLANSRWFTRGWTLQELIAPRRLEFFACNWTQIGSLKLDQSLLSAAGFGRSQKFPSLF